MRIEWMNEWGNWIEHVLIFFQNSKKKRLSDPDTNKLIVNERDKEREKDSRKWQTPQHRFSSRDTRCSSPVSLLPSTTYIPLTHVLTHNYLDTSSDIVRTKIVCTLGPGNTHSLFWLCRHTQHTNSHDIHDIQPRVQRTWFRIWSSMAWPSVGSTSPTAQGPLPRRPLPSSAKLDRTSPPMPTSPSGSTSTAQKSGRFFFLWKRLLDSLKKKFFSFSYTHHTHHHWKKNNNG